VGQHQLARTVSDGIDAGDVRFHAVVGLDKVVFDRDPRFAQGEGREQRAAADGDKNLFDFEELLAVRLLP
jgi:heat shock protein HspQ